MKKGVTLFFTLLAFSLFSQNPHHQCGFVGNGISPKEQNSVVERGVMTIPVVFHILLQDTSVISDAQILEQIEILNQDFGGITALKANVATQYSEIVNTNGKIRFCLTKYDPEGKPSKGIFRKKINPPNNIPFKSWLYETGKGGATAWNVQQFLNIWVTDLVSIAGYSGGISDSSLYDGIAIDFEYFGKKKNGFGEFSEGHTLTHEAGHYLGLKHIWGDNTIGCDCSDSDAIDDTPNQDCPTYDCPKNAISSCGQVVLYQNFMDYTEDACRTIFTKGQMRMMEQVLQNQRSELISQNHCASPSKFYKSAVFPNPVSQFAVLYNGSKERLEIAAYNLSGQVVQTWDSIEELVSLNFSDFTSGIYFLKISGEEKHFTLKIVVQH